MLIIVESPAKAKTISKIVGKTHTVKASVGHIRKLSSQKTTVDGRKLEINGVDIEKDFKPIYEIDKEKRKVISEIKKLAKTAKDGILFATDSDREGEAISWHLSEILGIKDKSKVRRLEFHEITKTAIKKAIDKPRSLNLNLVSAQRARQVLDKLVGFKVSPMIWKVMSNYKLSAGRVQSPALRLICEREKQILAFKPEEYWEIEGIFDSTSVKLQEIFLSSEQKKPENLDYFRLTKIKDKKLPELKAKKEVQELTEDLAKFPEFKVVSIKERKETSRTKPPFITSTLQQAASSSLGFSPKVTMGIAQKLYEGVDIDGSPTALITYMRTDSVNLSKDSIESCREYIQANFPEFVPDSAKFYKSKSRNAQEAHEAIRPTNPLLTPASLKSKLETRLWKLYDLIWKRTVACQMTDEVRVRFNFDLANQSKDVFAGSIAWTIHPGYKALYPNLISPKKNFDLKEGQVLFLQKVFYQQNFTKPPARYSAASLVKKLEDLGIGRPSTYASIISTLTDREYVESQKSQMMPTTLGMKVNDLLTENLQIVTSAELTAQMESFLDEVSRGKKSYQEILNNFWWDFKKEVEKTTDQVSLDREKYRSSRTDVLCPTCSSQMELRIGRFGEYFQCLSVAEHRFAKNFREYKIALEKAQQEYSEQTKGEKCQVCGKDMIVRVSKAKLKPYIACPDYRVGNKHSIISVNKPKTKADTKSSAKTTGKTTRKTKVKTKSKTKSRKKV